MKKFLAIIFVVFSASTFAAADVVSYQQKPNLLEIVKHIPEDYVSFIFNLTEYNASTYYAVAGSTLALLPFDQKITDGSKDAFNRNKFLTIGNEYRSLAKFTILNSTTRLFVPRSINGLAWYFGDGLFSLQLASGFAAYGLSATDYRSMHVSTQILEALLLTGPTVLAIKLMTGRESPAKSTQSGGKWQGYPGLITYSKDQSRYYAYPSGHVATAMTTLTVIAENYLDYSWIQPVGNVMVGMLMFALMNVGSHWPSDYPLAVLIGYTSARTVVAKDRARDKELVRAKLSAHAPRQGMRWLGLNPTCSDNLCGLQSEWWF